MESAISLAGARAKACASWTSLAAKRLVWSSAATLIPAAARLKVERIKLYAGMQCSPLCHRVQVDRQMLLARHLLRKMMAQVATLE